MSDLPIDELEAGIIVKELMAMRLFKAETPETTAFWIDGIVATCRTYDDWQIAVRRMFQERTTRNSDDARYYGMPFIGDFVALMPEDPRYEWYVAHEDGGRTRVVKYVGARSRFWQGACGNPRPTDPGVETVRMPYGVDGELVPVLVRKVPKGLSA